MDLLAAFLKHRRVSTDTRTVQPGDLFFALKGERFDGNQYAAQALDAGAAWAIVDDASIAVDDRFVMVDDVLTALQDLARAYRRQHSATFIGLTGSNGKTTTKELMRDVLASTYRTQATRGNLNNHIGVPLTLLEIAPDVEYAIIEMGANHQREIAELATIAEPDFGLITNIGEAHLEGFGGIEGVRIGKGELFDFLAAHDRPGFVNVDLPPLSEMGQEKGMRTIAYSLHAGNLNLKVQSHPTQLKFTWQHAGAGHEVLTQLTGAYNRFNAAAAISVGLHFKVTPEAISQALRGYVPDNNRSQIAQSQHNTLILDAYNANPSSMVLALDNLAGLDGEVFFIIGGMRELGKSADQAHQRICDHAERLGLDGWLVGTEFNACTTDYRTFEDASAVREALSISPIQGTTVLIKGSRGIRLETVVDLL
ncbi:MAG: UDP-N-acetylmuramoyl-tripeptide--D-alanyl-D-alanine ligase [Flavobacteriales bacterium]